MYYRFYLKKTNIMNNVISFFTLPIQLFNKVSKKFLISLFSITIYNKKNYDLLIYNNKEFGVPLNMLRAMYFSDTLQTIMYFREYLEYLNIFQNTIPYLLR